jgi:hypothetical protein
MSLRSARFLTDSGLRPLPYHGGPGWRQIAFGLRLVAGGYAVLVAGSAVGAALVWLVLAGPALPGPVGEDSHDLLPLFAALTLLLTAVFSYGLVLAGQWRCLMYAPPRGSAKELIYVCFHCLLLGSGLNAAGAYLDGGKTYAALQRGWAGLEALDPWSAGNLMQLGSVLLGVAGSLVFSQILRNVADCFNDRRRVRAVDLNLLFMGLLLGGTAGMHFCVRRLDFKGDALPWLAGGWLLCFVWHLWLVLGVNRCVADGLRRASLSRTVRIHGGGGGMPLSHTLSGPHRMVGRAAAPTPDEAAEGEAR